MSSISKQSTGGSGPTPPNVATSYISNNGTAVPAANILIVNGLDSNENNVNGIITKAGVAGTGTANEVDFVITNRIRGTVSTTNATPTIISSFPCGAIPGVYNFDIQVGGFNLTDVAGCGYFISGSVRTDGTTAILVGTPDKIVNEEFVTKSCDANLIVSGNNAIIQITGILAKNINWNCLSQYIFTS